MGEGGRGRAGKVEICISKVYPLLRRSCCCIFWLTNRHQRLYMRCWNHCCKLRCLFVFRLAQQIVDFCKQVFAIRVDTARFPHKTNAGVLCMLVLIVWNCCFSALYSPRSLVHCCWRASLPGGGRTGALRWLSEVSLALKPDQTQKIGPFRWFSCATVTCCFFLWYR